MKPDDFNAFCEVVIGFAELKGKALSNAAIKLYWNAMQHWSIDDFRAAAQHLLTTCEFMPTPKDFEDLRRDSEPTAGEAWESVLSKNGNPTDRAVRAARIAANGRYLGHLDIERELPHVQRRFLEIYRELTDVDETRAALPNFDPPSLPRITDGFKRLS